MLHNSITATTEKLTPESVDCVPVQSEIRLDMPHFERTCDTSFTKNGVHMSFFFHVMLQSKYRKKHFEATIIHFLNFMFMVSCISDDNNE
jgi:hypothetical protein